MLVVLPLAMLGAASASVASARSVHPHLIAGAAAAPGPNYRHINLWAGGASGDNSTALFNCEDSLWLLISLGNGQWQFKNQNSGLCLDVTGAGTTQGTTLQQWGCKSSSAGTNQAFATQ